MDMNLVENINKKLEELENKIQESYVNFDLSNDFEEWFSHLDRKTKIDIYKQYQLDIFSLDEY